MQDNSKFILDSIQELLDENEGVVTLSKLRSDMSADLRTRLGIKKSTGVNILKLKLEPLIEERFVIRKIGNSFCLFVPRDPDILALAALSEDKPLTVQELAKKSKLLTDKEVAGIMTDLAMKELARSGRVGIKINEKSVARFYSLGSQEARTEPMRQEAVRREEYTMQAMRRAYDELHKFWELVRICDVRRGLNWPREAFDEMIRTLRDNRTIQIFRADESLFTRDEIQDCFVDENKFIMGTVIWNGR